MILHLALHYNIIVPAILITFYFKEKRRLSKYLFLFGVFDGLMCLFDIVFDDDLLNLRRFVLILVVYCDIVYI